MIRKLAVSVVKGGAGKTTTVVNVATELSARGKRVLLVDLDPQGHVAKALGILHKQDGVALRATFIVDPDGVIRWVSVNDLSVGRSVDEVLRVLDALQTDELCPCNWQPGQETIQVPR